MDIRLELGKRILFFDGGFGSLLQERGLSPGELPELWNITHPQDVIAIHEAYANAGADILCANTFGANRLKYPEDCRKLVRAAVKNAREGIRRSGKKCYVALDIGPTGKLLKPLGELDFEEAVDIFKEIIEEGAAAGADLIAIETMNDTYELKAAVLAAKEGSTLPVFATTIFAENGKLLTGASPAAVTALLEGLGADAIGMNCGLGPKQMQKAFSEMERCATLPLIVNPNAGLPRVENGRTVYDVAPEEFAADVVEFVKKGAWVVGGCCGTTPAHIARLVDLCHQLQLEPLPRPPKEHTVVSSYSQAVYFGERPLLIGERINPTGKAKLKQALRGHDLDYILEAGIKQADAGAHLLDVNVGLPDIDEPAMMKEVICELQSVLALPLQIDTSNISAMELALRLYNGKPMVNSVNGKEESMAQVFPLVKKYGGVVVGLTLDESGIPDNVEGRVAVAEKIYARAAGYGIAKKDIIIDPLAMAISTNGDAAAIALETIRRITAQGGKTVLGVSNISFGLPMREYINATFFSMALAAGLSAGIINPNNAAMRRAYDTFCVLSGKDPQCMDYIEKYAKEQEENAAAKLSAPPQGTQTAADASATLQSTQAAGASAMQQNPQTAADSSTPPQSTQTAADASATPQSTQAAGASTMQPNPQTAAGSSAPHPPTGTATPQSDILTNYIIKGLKEPAYQETKALLPNLDTMEIINKILVPALDVVGKGFEQGTMFLPQLLMSAEAAKAGFEAIKEFVQAQGQAQVKKGTIVLATVKGDIHDIGKNIVKVLLENYGYEVIDLGKDVPPEAILEAVQRHSAPLVGLSALMTTTVMFMEETIRLLKKEVPTCKVMVGGAVLTQKYAEQIGADFYGKDAMQSVHYAQELFPD